MVSQFFFSIVLTRPQLLYVFFVLLNMDILPMGQTLFFCLPFTHNTNDYFNGIVNFGKKSQKEIDKLKLMYD